MSRVSLLASIVLILGLLLTACGPAAAPTPRPAPTPTLAPGVTPAPLSATPTPAPDRPKYGGELRAIHRYELAHYDMHQEVTIGVQAVTAPSYSLLVQIDPAEESKVLPDLAERWEMSPDGKVYTFYLRKGVRFHDGSPFTAKDIKASFDHIIWPPKGVLSPRAEVFGNVLKIETPDDFTVRFILKAPQAFFLGMVAMPFNHIFPSHILEKKGDMKKDIIGTGPFKFVEYVRGVSFEIVKNPDYFVAGRPYLDGIMHYIVKDFASQMAALRTGRGQFVTHFVEMTPYDMDIVRKEKPDMIVIPFTSPTHLNFSPNTEKKPWDDTRVRKAVSLTLDRQAGVTVVAKGLGEVGGPMPPGEWALPKEELMALPGYRQPKGQDIAEAKKLMAEAGYSEGFKTNIVTRTTGIYMDAAVFIKDQLAKIGIEAKIEGVEPAVILSRIVSKNYDSLAYQNSSAASDPDVILGEFYLPNSPRNWSYWKEPKMQELFTKQSQTMDPVQRRQLVLEMQRLALQSYPREVLYWVANVHVRWPEVRGFVRAKNLYQGLSYQDVWLAQ